VRVPITQLHKKPEALSLEEAAAFPLDYLTARRMLFTRGRLARGETILIWGASGSLGSAAVRLAAWAGADVIASIGKAEYASPVKALGANVVVNYNTMLYKWSGAELAESVRISFLSRLVPPRSRAALRQ
jgi:alcohol dehydrogenase